MGASLVSGGVGKWKVEGAELERGEGSSPGEEGGEEEAKAWFGGHMMGAVIPNPA